MFPLLWRGDVSPSHDRGLRTRYVERSGQSAAPSSGRPGLGLGGWVSDENLFVGIGRVSIFIRHARSLKEKRQIFKSIRHKLTNLGFSVAECGSLDHPKSGTLGFAYTGRKESEVSNVLEEARKLFFGDFEVVSDRIEIVDFDYLDEQLYDDDKYGDRED